MKPSRLLEEAVAAFEREVIIAALERAGGNRSETARQLGLARTHRYSKLEEHRIAAPESQLTSGS